MITNNTTTIFEIVKQNDKYLLSGTNEEVFPTGIALNLKIAGEVNTLGKIDTYTLTDIMDNAIIGNYTAFQITNIEKGNPIGNSRIINYSLTNYVRNFTPKTYYDYKPEELMQLGHS